MRFFYFIMRTSEPCSSQHDRHFSRYSSVLNHFTLSACRSMSRENQLLEVFLGKTSCSHIPPTTTYHENVKTIEQKHRFFFVFLDHWCVHQYIPCGLSAKVAHLNACRSISEERLDVSTTPLLLPMMKDMIKYM